jgi:hypothetical protein
VQDWNWPVAQVLSPFLASVGGPLVPHVRRIFETDDEIWKYWVIVTIMGESAVVAEAFREELERLARMPTESEAREELDEVARGVIEKHGWDVG